MTREEAREELKAELEELISGSGLTGHVKEELDKNPDFKYVYEANMMAIASLKAWGEIKQEINDLFSKPACYMPNYDAYKMFLEIIDKHLHEVEEYDT